MGSNKSMGFHELQALFRDNRLQSSMGLVTEVEVLENGSVGRCKVKILPEEREIVARIGFSYAGFCIPEVKDLVAVLNIRGDEDNALIIARFSSKEDAIPKGAREGHLVLKSLGPSKKTYVTSDEKILLGGDGDGADPDEPLVLGKVFKQFEKDFIDKITDLEDKLASQASQLNAMATTLSTMNTQLIVLEGVLASHVHPGVLPGGSSTAPSPAMAAAAAVDIAFRTADVATHSGYASSFSTTQSDILANKADIEALKASPIEDDAILSDLSFTKKSP